MESELINIFCHKLPGDISRAVHNEYTNRWDEIKRIWEFPQNRYGILKRHSSTIQHLLAMSIFYRRLLCGLDGACDFYNAVKRSSRNSEHNVIIIGKYKLDSREYKKLQSIRISFQKLKEKYDIDDYFFDYVETYEFLNNCKDFYYNHVRQQPNRPSPDPEEDLPF